MSELINELLAEHQACYTGHVLLVAGTTDVPQRALNGARSIQREEPHRAALGNFRIFARKNAVQVGLHAS